MHKKHLFHLPVTLSIFFALIWVAVLTAKDAQGSDAASFYKGKTIRIVVGYSPGGGFDTFARLVARNFGQHVPANPNVIVVNMPGAGSLSAANRIYNMASPKGLTLVTFHYSNVPLDFIGDPNVQFDPLKYHWIGSPSIGGLPRTLFIRSDLPIHNLQDLKNSKQTITLGGNGCKHGLSCCRQVSTTNRLPSQKRPWLSWVIGCHGSPRAKRSGRADHHAVLSGNDLQTLPR